MREGCFMASGMFWGGFLILIGVVVLLRVIFRIDIPIFKILFGLLLIYFGVRIIFGGGWFCPWWRHHRVYQEPPPASAAGPQNEYNILFGKARYDFSAITLQKPFTPVRVNIVFGSAAAKLDPAMPVKIAASSVFGSALTPDETNIAFGTHVYRTPNLNENEPYLYIDARVVFGSLEFTR